MLSGAFHVLSFSQWYFSIWSLMSIRMVCNDGKPLKNHLFRRIKKRLCFYSSLVLNLRDVQHCDRHEACSRQTKIMVITWSTIQLTVDIKEVKIISPLMISVQINNCVAVKQISWDLIGPIRPPAQCHLSNLTKSTDSIVLIYSGTIYRPHMIKCWDQRGKCQLTFCIILKSKKISIFTGGTD